MRRFRTGMAVTVIALIGVLGGIERLGQRWAAAGSHEATVHWDRLTADRLRQAVMSRHMREEDRPGVPADGGAMTRQFDADGVFRSEPADGSAVAPGHWMVADDHLCILPAGGQSWACEDVAVSGDGLDLRTTAADGTQRHWRYDDLG